MDFNRNYNLVPSRSISRFLLTVVTSVKLDDFRHFMRFSPGCLNIGSECLCLFFIVIFFLLWLGNSRISFRVSFFQATFTFCPSPILDFHSPLFPGVLFFILKYIKPGRGAFDLVYGMTEINTEVMSKISCVCVSQSQVLSLSTTPSTPCLSVCFLILTVTNSRLPDFFSFREG